MYPCVITLSLLNVSNVQRVMRMSLVLSLTSNVGVQLVVP